MAAKANWKNQKAQFSKSFKNQLPSPMNPFEESPETPKAMAYPVAQKKSPPTQASSMFFIRMFEVFFERVKPDSTIANPACMKNTMLAVTSNHVVSTAVTRSAIWSSVLGPSWAEAEEKIAIARSAPASNPSGRRNLLLITH